jgi:hypothetical protein
LAWKVISSLHSSGLFGWQRIISGIYSAGRSAKLILYPLIWNPELPHCMVTHSFSVSLHQRKKKPCSRW